MAVSRTHQYFVAAGLVWEAYLSGSIGMLRRDAMLAALREEFLR